MLPSILGDLFRELEGLRPKQQKAELLRRRGSILSELDGAFLSGQADAVVKGLKELLERIEIIPAVHVPPMLRSLNPWPKDEDPGGKSPPPVSEKK
jgi:hypothetical protein